LEFKSKFDKPFLSKFNLCLNIVSLRTMFLHSFFQWRRDVAFAGFEVPIQMDISAEKMIFGVAGIDPQRRDELIKVCRLWFDG